MNQHEPERDNVRPLRPDGELPAERLRWTRLLEARGPEASAAAWLDVQCHELAGVVSGLVFMRSAQDGAFEPLAAWPRAGDAPAQLVSAARHVLEEGRPLALQLEADGDRGASHTLLGQPIESGGVQIAAVVLELEPAAPAELERALRRLAWGAAWLSLRLGAPPATAPGAGPLLDLLAAPVEHERFVASATALASELAERFQCDRVSLGFVQRGRVRLRAFSHAAEFAPRANLVRAVEAVMDQALERGMALRWPPGPGSETLATGEHATLADQTGATAICSVPFAEGERACGVATLERLGAPFERDELRMIEAALALSGPLLELRRRDDRWIGFKLVEAARAGAAAVLGPNRVALKLVTAALLALSAFLVFAQAPYRVTADGELEARLQRSAISPFDGYIAQAPARAGDVVKRGDLLAALDDRELRLEKVRVEGRLGQLDKQLRQAVAGRDAAEIGILAAQADQARAQLALIEEQLSRTRVEAPFDGVVVTGDLSQALGAPVSRGDVLFEVAPLDEFRVVLKADERDVDELAPGQRGRFALAANPGTQLPFEVETITPLSEAGDGRNTFRVEARLLEHVTEPRPGMHGVGKVEIDRRKLLWIWTHDVVDWLRLFFWNWMP